MDISFVIPCYCSSKTLPFVIAEVKMAMEKIDISDYEIILVNDCSPDEGKTWQKIVDLCVEDPHIKGVNLAKNGGQGAAIMAGLSQAEGKLVAVGDDDGQTVYEVIPEMIQEIHNKNFDIVCGKYTDRGQRSLIRSFGSWFNWKMMCYTLEIPSNIALSIFFVAKKFVIEEILKYTNPYPYILGLMAQTTHNIGNIEVEQRERLVGKSGYTFSKLISVWMDGMTAFSVKPLRIAALLGFLFAGAGFLIGIITILRKLIYPDILAGYSSMIAALMLIGGIIMVILGLIGEYIGRIYICLNHCPQYVIKEKRNIKEEKQNEKNADIWV